MAFYPAYTDAIGKVGNPAGRMYNEDIAVFTLPCDIDARDIMAVAEHDPGIRDEILMTGSSTDQIDSGGKSPVSFTEPKRVGVNKVDGLESDLNIVRRCRG